MYFIREANTLDDFDAFLALKSQKDAVKWSGFEAAPNPDNFKRYFIERVLNNPLTHVMLLCKHDGEGNSIIGYRQYDQISENEIEIRGTTIKREYQGTDAIEALNTLMVKHYKEKGYKLFSAWVSEKNKASEYVNRIAGWTKTNECIIQNIPLLGGEHKFYKWVWRCE